jgi:hypothetical protein
MGANRSAGELSGYPLAAISVNFRGMDGRNFLTFEIRYTVYLL